MKRRLLVSLGVFLALCSGSAVAAGIPIAPGQTLFLKADGWATAGSLPVLAKSAGRLVPWVGTAITFGPLIYRGIELLAEDGTLIRQPITMPSPGLWDPLAPPTPAPQPQIIPPGGLPPGVTLDSVAQRCDPYSCGMSETLRSCLTNYAVPGASSGKFCKVGTEHFTSDPNPGPGSTYIDPQATGTNSCPSGFGISGDQCFYNWPAPQTRDHISDGKCDGPYAGSDPDCGAYAPSGPQTFYGTDAEGPYTIDITPGSGGGAKIRRRAQTTGPNGDTQVESDDIDFGPDGRMTGGTHTTQPGAHLSPDPTNPTNPTPVPQTNYQDPTNPGLQNPPAPTPVNFPNDYQRDITGKETNQKLGEQLTELRKIESDLGQIHRDLTEVGTQADPNDPNSGQTAGEIFSTFTNNPKISGLMGWQMPPHNAACPTTQFTWNGHTFLVNAHCPLIDDSFPLIRMVMTTVFILGGTFIVLRA